MVLVEVDQGAGSGQAAYGLCMNDQRQHPAMPLVYVASALMNERHTSPPSDSPSLQAMMGDGSAEVEGTARIKGELILVQNWFAELKERVENYRPRISPTQPSPNLSITHSLSAWAVRC